MPWLSWLIFFPLGGAVLIALLPREADRAIKRWAAIVAIAECAFSLPLWWQLVPGQPGWQFVEKRPWLPFLGSSYYLGVDGISNPMVSLAGGSPPLNHS